MATKREGSAASYVAAMGLLFALAMALAAAESFLLPALPLGIKLGLSNVVTMFTLFVMGRRDAVIMAVLKSSFVLLTRGAVSAAISVSGGLASVLVMILLRLLTKEKVSILFLSCLGAVAHNLGQLLTASRFMGTDKIFSLLPLLVGAGLLMGALTGTLLRFLGPYLKRVPVFRSR